MNKSDSISKLATALSKAQSEMPAAEMNAENPFFNSRYADLGSVIKAAKPILSKHGLSISQFPIGSSGSIGLETIVMHESGEWISNYYEVDVTGKNIAQAAGSTISYFRRYAYAAVLGIYADQDIDGNHPGNNNSTKKAGGTIEGADKQVNTKKIERPMSAEQARDAIQMKALRHFENNRSMSEKQRKLFPIVWNGLFDNNDDRYYVTEWLFGVTSSTELTDVQKLSLIDWMSLEKDEQGHFVPNSDAIKERSNMVSAALVDKGQQSMGI